MQTDKIRFKNEKHQNITKFRYLFQAEIYMVMCNYYKGRSIT